VDAKSCIPRFEESEVRFRQSPLGAWSTPLIDVYVLIKAVIGFNSKRILELGSYRGDTARQIAENTPEDARICAVDIHPDHGASYRDQPVARRIDRRVGAISRGLFLADEKFDFIFVDADHDYKSAMNDTAVALDVLSEDGVIFWHDYHFANYFHGRAGVPEALSHFASQHAIVSIGGTLLAMHSRHPGWETKNLAAREPSAETPADTWLDCVDEVLLFEPDV
jgi:predicted O-methyltransferase YrrM